MLVYQRVVHIDHFLVLISRAWMEIGSPHVDPVTFSPRNIPVIHRFRRKSEFSATNQWEFGTSINPLNTYICQSLGLRRKPLDWDN